MNIHPQTQEAYKLLHNGTLALARAERQGMRVDMDQLTAKKAHLRRRILRLEEQFMDTAFYRKWERTSKNINIHSPDQLKDHLYNTLGLKPVKVTATSTEEETSGAVDDEALKQLKIPELDILLEARKLKKIKDTYLASFEREQVDGYIHPVFNLHLVKTFRSSSDHPNFQNIPIRDQEAKNICRGMLFPRPGHQILEIDFKGAEVSANACINKDKKLMSYLHDPTTDMHRDQAREIYMFDGKEPFKPEAFKLLRQAAKNGFVFAEFYGDYFKNCAVNTACNWGQLPKGKWKPGQGIMLADNLSLADHLISRGITELGDIKSINGKTTVTGFTRHMQEVEEKFWETFYGYAEWKKKWYAEYLRKGYFDLLTGFRCSGVMAKNNVINYPGQGTAFHFLLWSFIEADYVMYEAQQWDTKLMGQIHDSMILDVNPGELEHVVRTIRKIITEMLPRHWSWINVPMTADFEVCEIDRPWSEKKPLKM